MLPEIPRIDRRAVTSVSPEYEDSGLFKGGIVQVKLALVPVFETSSRGDCTVRGFSAEGKDVTVIVAGRRRPHFQSLYDQLRYMYAQAHYQDNIRGLRMRNVNSIQLPVQCEGTWRARMTLDEHGRETRSIQFMMARWAFQRHDGQTLTFGTAARLPKKDASPKRGEGVKSTNWPLSTPNKAAYGG